VVADPKLAEGQDGIAPVAVAEPSGEEPAIRGLILASAPGRNGLAHPPAPPAPVATAAIETQGERRLGAVARPVAKPMVAPAPERRPDAAAPAAVTVAFDLRAPAGRGGPVQLVRRAPATTAAAGPAEFRVQLAALRDEANATYVWHDYVAAFGPLAAGLTRYDVQAGTRSGTFHLLQIGPLGDLAHAEAMCDQIKQRGHDCAVVQVLS
jgi:cell division septation protein DedD